MAAHDPKRTEKRACSECGGAVLGADEVGTAADYAGGKFGWCSSCYIKSHRNLAKDCDDYAEEMTRRRFAEVARKEAAESQGASPRSVYLCEHLWTRWDVTEGYILGCPPPSDDHFFFTRHCELCGLDDACYGLHYPETPADLDISWLAGPF